MSGDQTFTYQTDSVYYFDSIVTASDTQRLVKAFYQSSGNQYNITVTLKYYNPTDTSVILTGNGGSDPNSFGQLFVKTASKEITYFKNVVDGRFEFHKATNDSIYGNFHFTAQDSTGKNVSVSNGGFTIPKRKF